MPVCALDALLSAVEPEARRHWTVRSSSPAPSVTHLTIDSRQVAPGTLFVALRGARSDGHDFVERAVEAGAAAVMIDAAEAGRFDALTLPLILVPSTRGALGPLARAFYEDPLSKLRAVIGVTGTNGKTTSTYIAESLLEGAGWCVGVIGTVNYRWDNGRVVRPAINTTPESLTLYQLAHEMVADGVQVLVMEVSSHALETHRLEGVAFDAALFTNLTQDHLDFHGSMAAYKAAKAKLFFEHLRPDARAVLNLDDPVGREWFELLKSRGSITVYGYSIEGEAHPEAAPHLTARAWRDGLEGIEAELATGARLHVPLLGDFNLSNVLGVVGALAALELVSIDRALELLPGCHMVPGRLQRVNPGQHPATFVDYAHSPDALAHTLATLRPHARGALWCVFGCGGDRDRGKRPIMGKIAAELADRVILTSDNPRSEPPMQIIDEIILGVSGIEQAAHVEVEPDRDMAIRAAIHNAEREDVVLIAGKGHETYQEIASGRIDFDDVAHARAALERSAARHLTAMEEE